MKQRMKLNNDNYVEEAERVILVLKQKTDKRGNPSVVTTSKLRNLLAMTADIYNEVVNEKEERLPEEITSRINYLKVRFIYEAGRERKVGELVEEGDIIGHLNDIKGSREQYICFSRYMEALVAFRKYHIKGDD